ncbi:MAG: 2Fe-2S iron-sulfur cluster-binding protein [Usitatibacter sp.]
MNWEEVQAWIALSGGLIVIGALAQVVFGVVRGAQDVVLARRRNELQLERLRQSVASATLVREMAEQREIGSWSGTRKFRIAAKRMEADDVCSFYFVPHDRKPLPGFRPGQYLTFSLRLPDRDKPLVRCYSLSDSPFQRDHYRVTIKRLSPPPGAGDAPPGLSSTFFHRDLNEGDIVDVKAPAGAFCLDLAEHRPVVFIAGGIGLTPLFSMLKAICESGSKREAWFFYGIRHGGEHVFREELQRFAPKHENVKLVVCYDAPRAGDQSGVSHHLEERVSTDLLKRTLPSSNYDFYVCGPPPMMAALTQGLAAWGVPEERIFTEAFGPASVKTIEKPAPLVSPQPQVTFARSGKTVAWDGGDNLLEFAEAHGVKPDFGCRAGGCATCMTAVKSGEVTYVRAPDARPDSGSCLICVARPKTDLVLDA